MKEEAMNCKENCKGICELLTAYLDGEVTKEEKAIVESHLADCPQCQAELEALKATQAGLKCLLTSMAEEAAPSSEAWKNVRSKIEKKDGWFESLGKILSSQKWQGVAVTAMVVVVAVSVAVWQISGAGESPALVAPAPAGNASVVPTVPKLYDTPAAPPPAQVTVNPPTVTVPAPAPAPAPTTPPPAPVTPPPPAIPPPITGAPPPNITVGAPPLAQVTVQAPPPSTVWTINATSITANSAILTGRLNYVSSGIEVAFEYGTTAEFGNRSTYIPMSAIGDFSALITGLEPYTTYHYRAVGRRVGINGSYEAGGTATFITYPQSLTVSSTAMDVPRPASPPATDTSLKVPLWFWFLLTATLLAAVIIIFVSGRRAKI